MSYRISQRERGKEGIDRGFAQAKREKIGFIRAGKARGISGGV